MNKIITKKINKYNNNKDNVFHIMEENKKEIKKICTELDLDPYRKIRKEDKEKIMDIIIMECIQYI